MIEDLGWSLGTAAVTASFHVHEVWFANRPLQFEDFSVMAASWSCDFNNDGTPDSTEKNPVHTYTTTGDFVAKLTINGDSNLSKMVTIKVLAEPTIPYSNDFNADDGGFYSFIMSGLSVGKWLWGAGTTGNFSGDGATIEGAKNWMTGTGGHHGYNSKAALESPGFLLAANASGDYFLDFRYRAMTAGISAVSQFLRIRQQ